MTTIIGVDFSGHRDDRNTWVARARLDPAGILRFTGVHPTRRADLYHLLTAIPTPAVVALDFPFGVPGEFASQICRHLPPSDMREVWRIMDGMAYEDFLTLRETFLTARADLPQLQREPKRAGDRRHHPESYSPLHSVNPNMLPMTFLGMQMLHRWHREYPSRWWVPPLPATASDPDVTLLELMPGALLKTLGLPYKGYKRGMHAAERREEILDHLASASGVPTPNLEPVRLGCLANDDCLDSVVAAVGAACWAVDSGRFRHPGVDEMAAAKLEGWIYVPLPPPADQQPDQADGQQRSHQLHRDEQGR